MRLRHDTAPEEGARVVRLAWFVSFFATLALVAILSLAKSAQALPVIGPVIPGTAAAGPTDPEDEDEGDGQEEEFELGECAEDDEECEEEGGEIEAPDECLLSSAEATVFASSAQDKVRLAVRYKTISPSLVAISLGLHGSKGSLYLGQSKKQLDGSGVFRQTEALSEPQMAKAVGAKDFTVQLYAVRAPSYCRHYFERHLTVRRASPSGLTWADPEAALRR